MRRKHHNRRTGGLRVGKTEAEDVPARPKSCKVVTVKVAADVLKTRASELLLREPELRVPSFGDFAGRSRRAAAGGARR